MHFWISKKELGVSRKNYFLQKKVGDLFCTKIHILKKLSFSRSKFIVQKFYLQFAILVIDRWRGIYLSCHITFKVIEKSFLVIWEYCFVKRIFYVLFWYGHTVSVSWCGYDHYFGYVLLVMCSEKSTNINTSTKTQQHPIIYNSFINRVFCDPIPRSVLRWKK